MIHLGKTQTRRLVFITLKTVNPFTWDGMITQIDHDNRCSFGLSGQFHLRGMCSGVSRKQKLVTENYGTAKGQQASYKF